MAGEPGISRKWKPFATDRAPWLNLDILQRESLDDLLSAYDLDHLPETPRAEFNLAWHRLDPWPDPVAGLEQLKRIAIIDPDSNGHIALQVDLARRTGLPWDVILGAEIARAYKPQPAVYLRSAESIGLDPSEVVMVAAHNTDLVAARECGMMTALVPRQHEYGEDQSTVLHAEHAYDLIARDFQDLADQLTGSA